MLHSDIRQGLGPAEQGPQIKRLYEEGKYATYVRPPHAVALFEIKSLGVR